MTYSQWEIKNTLGPGISPESFLKIDNKLLAGNNDGVYSSTDNGDSWTVSDGFIHFTTRVLTFSVSGNKIFAGSFGNGVFFSSDNGNNWIKRSDGIKDSIIYSLAIINNLIFASTLNGGVYLSTDDGVNWIQKNNGLTDSNIYSIAVNGNYLYAAGDSGVHLSTDFGNNWINIGLQDNHVFEILIDKNNIIACTGSNGVYMSSDNGKNWISKNKGLDTLKLEGPIAITGNNIFMTVLNKGIYLSTDYGETWTRKSDGLGTSNPICLYIVDDYIFAGHVGDGFSRAKLIDFGIISEVKSNEIEQNPLITYPNPVESSITLNVPLQDQTSEITIYSIIGTEVLVTEYQNSIDVSSLSAGIYYLKVKDKVCRFIKI